MTQKSSTNPQSVDNMTTAEKGEKAFRAKDVLSRNADVTYAQVDMRKRHDYVSKGLKKVKPDNLFPHLTVGNMAVNDWEYLRREVPHTWYVDGRFPRMGFLSRDEAAIVHNTALMFKGKRALEIGCWKGWSTAHLLKAGVKLDVVDIVLEDKDARKELEEIASGLNASKRTTFTAGQSATTVPEVAEKFDRKWSLIFIDGDHEVPAPAQDAQMCADYAEADALIIFHDLSSPAVSAGLEVLQKLGWNTRVYQTMQIVGVAWRGNVTPVPHTPDPTVDWTIPDHLARFQFIHETDEDFSARGLANQERFSRLSLAHQNLIAQHSRLALDFSAIEEQRSEALGSYEFYKAELAKTVTEMSAALAERTSEMDVKITELNAANAVVRRLETVLNNPLVRFARNITRRFR